MAAYLISRLRVKDPELMRKYAEKSRPIVAAHGGEYVVRSDNVEALDGTYDGRRLIIVKFPDVKNIRAFWDTDEYQELRKMRLAATDSDVWLIQED